MAFGKNNKYCSFCGSSTNRMVTGPGGVTICESCVEKCRSILYDDDSKTQKTGSASTLPDKLPTPHELKEYLDQYVIGQDQAKKILSVAVYNHYKRVKFEKELEDKENVSLDKSNILMMGPTGTGKTLLARTLATRLSVPFAIADATTITEAGYVGEDVENILLKLIQAADDDISAAEHGIIFLDEVDKIAKKGENVSITRDVSGEGVQQALLKIIEGTVASVPPQGGRKHPNQEMLKIDTRNILFICGGAFVGLDRIIEKRMDTSSMGFGKNVGDSRDKDLATLYSNVLPDDLIKFGLIPEFIGRLPIHVALNELHVEDLERILTEPKNSIIRQYQATMKLDNVELEFTKEAIHSIAQTAFDQKTGARGLRSIVETIMTDIMYDVPSYSDVAKIIIEESTVTKKTKPVLLGADGKAVDRKLLT
ncbi:MAG: ATP-dependent Clp protease ATP-binding subunit ClpX [Spirochaetales bacterium]|nr:ATP-dependent Clp protease ATP-binding subunit ClpX [Spirochaetales bacterium]MBQ4281775.1 ATP-dependent Clp protease ATP-binding subunit ClpX [Spirochaetales bacterium]MBQ7282214.1 ATP-dependent Clp protease ATP-binding subunit ClpX [Spirochaetales bacterium]